MRVAPAVAVEGRGGVRALELFLISARLAQHARTAPRNTQPSLRLPAPSRAPRTTVPVCLKWRTFDERVTLMWFDETRADAKQTTVATSIRATNYFVAGGMLPGCQTR